MVKILNTGSYHLHFLIPSANLDIILSYYQAQVYLDFLMGHVLKFRYHVARVFIVQEVNVLGLGGLEVTCSPRDPRFAGSNPTDVDGFSQDVKILSTSPPGGTLSWGSRV